MPDDQNFAHYEKMSATLLSEQPLAPKAKYYKIDNNWQELFAHCEQQLLAHKTWRYSWWSYWAVLAEFFKPSRYVWLVVPNLMGRGSPVNGSILDSTGLQAVRTCAAGMWTGLTSPSRPWFKLGVPKTVKIDAEGQAWIEDTVDRIYTILEGSNFYDIMAQAFQDVTVFGTAPVICYPDSQDVVRFYLPCAGEYFLGSSARLSNDTFIREFQLTVKQIVDQFGLEASPEDVQKMWLQGAQGLSREFVVCHLIEPNYAIAKAGSMKNGSPEMLDVLPGKWTYRELYWIRGITGMQPLSKKGFDRKPFMAARWATTSNDAYGRSPCMDALGDNKQVQQETRRKGEFIEKGVRPPMGANPELKNEPSSILPGNVTYLDTSNGKKGFWPLFEPNANWLVGMTEDIKQVNARIQDCLYVNVFMAISRMAGVQPRNELELTKRDLERLQELGPFITRFEREFAGPVVQEVFWIGKEKGLFKPVPRSLNGIPLQISYMSIMRMAQRAAKAVGMKDFFQTGGALSLAAKTAGVPDPLRTVKLDEALREYGDVSDFPSHLFYTDDQVAAHDQIREQVMKQQQAAQAAPQVMATAAGAAKDLSQVQMPNGATGLSTILKGAA